MRPEPEHPDRPAKGRRRPLAVDSLLATAYATASLLLGQEPPPAPWHALDATGTALTLLVSAALVARRIAPVPVLATVVALWSTYIACGYWPVVNSPASLLALYTVAAARPTRTAALGAGAVGAAWLFAGAAHAGYGSMKTVLVQAAAFPLVMVFFGRTAGRAAERSRHLAELTRRLRAEQEARALQAVTEERVRIARELHDVVAHHLSVVSLQAGMASYVFDADPATARGALDTIAATGREALEELRRLLTLLRVDPEDLPPTAPGPRDDDHSPERYTPAPGLDRLDEMLRRVRAAGTPVDLRVDGEPRALPPGMDLCAYRVVQEALTNVLRHAGPATATVTVRYDPRALTVRITDDGRAPAAPAHRPATGHGLIGMRERARIYRGTLSAGPRAQGGFEVLLSLPVPLARGARPDAPRSP
ncbi:ATPase [Kitasatospora herbaricolor]|uniref:sensor histidine kinase n=1 Tax=Kitasatospora herbaricolor TaxID=68217 RepID=UPI00174E5BD7|nr:histidine kinase [Kitasatospora herbaricolor]MDQ0313540.1 signal transduction histidine kinase [Kitasatospora herbaricolor]GGV47380.1 ATPase [Kitasatospora herbaricolor]